MTDTTVDVAVVTHNTRDLVLECLQSLWDQEGLGRVVLVDDGSTDGTVAAVRERFPEVELLADGANRGYGAAANAAIEACASPAVLLLNSDTRLEPGSLVRLRRHLEGNPSAAVVGPRLLNADGSLQPSCFPFPSPRTAFLGETGLGYFVRFVPVLRRTNLRTWRHDKARTVPWVRGAALMIRREPFLRVGGFDTAFYMYFEEVDLALRLARAGWSVQFSPVASVYHVGGASTEQQRAEMRVRYYASMERFYLRHRRPWERWVLRAILAGTMAFRLVRDRMRLLVSRAPDEREGLRRDVEAWRRIMAGP
jgi:GT2 family glycosyltransferase